MAKPYQTFLKKNIDLASLGVEKRSHNVPYFCTSKGASMIGWAGVTVSISALFEALARWSLLSVP